MPEEINRIIVDHISDICLAPDMVSKNNLLREGIKTDYVVGDTGIDACLRMKRIIEKRGKKQNRNRKKILLHYIERKILIMM